MTRKIPIHKQLEMLEARYEIAEKHIDNTLPKKHYEKRLQSMVHMLSKEPKLIELMREGIYVWVDDELIHINDVEAFVLLNRIFE